MKYGIFLDLEKKNKSKINRFKKKLSHKTVGKKAYFDHETHLTIFCFTTNANLKVVKEKFLNEFSNEKKNINISVKSKKIFYDDPLTYLDTIIFEIVKSKTLIKIQEKIFHTYKNVIIKETKTKLLNKVLHNNQIKYGYPFFGKIWIPHITLGSLDLKKNLNVLKSFKKTKINHKMSKNKITLNKIFRNGKFRKIV